MTGDAATMTPRRKQQCHGKDDNFTMQTMGDDADNDNRDDNADNDAGINTDNNAAVLTIDDDADDNAREVKTKIGLSGNIKLGCACKNASVRCKKPVIHALAREKANSRNTHPNVIAHTNTMNEGNKCNFVSEKEVDVVAMCQKRQHNMGRLEAIQYFDTNKDERLTWLAPLFYDAKWGASEGKAATPEDSSHCQKELSMNCEMK
jgi:hypothetical protein